MHFLKTNKTKQTTTAPIIDAANFKRTKILATIGPVTHSYEMIKAMIDAGANGFRYNFSHGTHEEAAERTLWVRRAAQELGKPIAIIQDLQGPKIRLGDFEGIITVQPNQELTLAYHEFARDDVLPTQYDLSGKVQPGHRVLFSDGRLRTTVLRVEGNHVIVRAENDGVLTRRKGINLPDTDLKGDIITDKDIRDIAFAASQDFDYISLSFIQSAEDLVHFRELLARYQVNAKVIAKIETSAALENLESIIEQCDAVMIARGDLAIETSPESVPIVTRRIIKLCQEKGKLSIVATEVLSSMVDNPSPTRAEMSDIASAVISGTDCLMLSDETARGKYPIEAISVMKKGILYTQDNANLSPIWYKEEDSRLHSAVSSAVITLAHQVNAKAIVAETHSGATALSIASHRPNMPIIIVTSSERVAQQLALLYGSKVFIRNETRNTGTKLTDWLRQNGVFHSGDIIVAASGRHPGKTGGTDTIKVRVLE